MITQITIKGFKSLQSLNLALSHLNLFVGTNASGKSNFFDALRVLQGIGYGFTIDEILNGKPKSASSEVWEGIRGGSAKADFICRTGDENASQEKVIEFGLTVPADPYISNLFRKNKNKFVLELPGYEPEPPLVEYSLGISARIGSVRQERLSIGDSLIFDTVDLDNDAQSPVLKVRYNVVGPGRKPHLQFERSRSVLHQLPRDPSCTNFAREVILWLREAISNTQRIDPAPAILRDYSQAHTAKRMGERGENFAALINAIQSDERTRSAYVSWLKQLTPTELDDVTVLEGALGEPLFAIKEGSVVYPAPILSDGTLRFAAITAAFFQPDMPGILTIEEIENGIHPSRLRLLVELLKSRASLDRQVMATTHSPVVLAWLEPSDYESTFLCSRDEETGTSRIVPLSNVPNFNSIVQNQSIGELLTEGWLEGAL